MTDISAAALPPRQPRIEARDRKHALFPVYMQYFSSMAGQLVQASAFSDWLYSYGRQLVSENAAKDADYPAFLDWMRANHGGARQCPAGCFPHNFRYWQQGGRW